MFNLVLFGPPGSGKGTQAAKLVAKYNFVHLSTGDILREEIRKGTPVGVEAKALIDHGELMHDEVVIDMIRARLAELKGATGFIFDGFPRTEKQAEELDKMLVAMGMNIDMMVTLNVDEDEIMHRILERGKSSGRADDQDPEIIKNRIRIYRRQTEVVAQYYKKQGKYKAINNMGTVDETFAALCSIIGE